MTLTKSSKMVNRNVGKRPRDAVPIRTPRDDHGVTLILPRLHLHGIRIAESETVGRVDGDAAPITGPGCWATDSLSRLGHLLDDVKVPTQGSLGVHTVTVDLALNCRGNAWMGGMTSRGGITEVMD